MIEVNFFEKKETNVLPYLILSGFVVGVIVLLTYFLFLSAHYNRVDAQNVQIMQQQSEQVALSRDIQQIERLTTQNRETITILDEQTFPVAFATEHVSSFIPNEDTQLVMLNVTTTGQIMLNLEAVGVEESASIIEELESVSYINRVNVTRLQQTSSEEGLYEIDLTIDYDESLLKEEALLWQ
ncbi:hypothetical protein [Alkalibacterium sp. MB6]|uniref:hypothetical protein n=1 Tax=Alkalibacterium sp. MB6 TaxID=2081965 RepID=UPI0013797C43|nr:hypothetical protein [Alkalibacterium sp. MB6]